MPQGPGAGVGAHGAEHGGCQPRPGVCGGLWGSAPLPPGCCRGKLERRSPELPAEPSPGEGSDRKGTAAPRCRCQVSPRSPCPLPCPDPWPCSSFPSSASPSSPSPRPLAADHSRSPPASLLPALPFSHPPGPPGLLWPPASTAPPPAPGDGMGHGTGWPGPCSLVAQRPVSPCSGCIPRRCGTRASLLSAQFPRKAQCSAAGTEHPQASRWQHCSGIGVERLQAEDDPKPLPPTAPMGET